jgi:hypothetical protein
LRSWATPESSLNRFVVADAGMVACSVSGFVTELPGYIEPMSVHVLAAVFLFVTAANAAEVCHGIAEAPKIRDSFPDDEIEKHPSEGGQAVSRSFRLAMKAGGPEFLITVRALPLNTAANEIVHAGEIVIAECKDGKQRQVLPIMTYQEIGVENLRAFDINFDGYLDLSMLVEVGSTFGRQAWWIYDPAGGKFVKNRLAQQLADIRSNGYSIDRKKHEIAVRNMRAGCPDLTTRSRVGVNGLVVVHEERFVQSVPCVVTFLDRVGGQMKVTAVRKFVEDKLIQ